MILNLIGLGLLVFDPFEPEIPPPPKQYLQQTCQLKGCDFVLLNAIAECESGWRMVKNSQSTAFGYFQIIDGTEKTTPQYAEGERKFDPYTNIDMGVYLYEQRGTNPWISSRGCWQGRYWQAKAQSAESSAIH